MYETTKVIRNNKMKSSFRNKMKLKGIKILEICIRELRTDISHKSIIKNKNGDYVANSQAILKS